jgi:hypothetical protein
VIVREVLGVLEDEEYRLSMVCKCSVKLADAERARLTLAKTTNAGRMIRWLAPFAMQSMCPAADGLDLRMAASDTLARAVEFVPASTPVTTLLLGSNTSTALEELLGCGSYDALVTTDVFLSRHRRLRRELPRLGVSSVLVPCRPRPPLTTQSRSALRAESLGHLDRIGAHR